MFTQSKKIIAILSTAALLGGGANIALAADHGHSHESHASHAQEAPKLTLNNGKKWETDENLRKGMSLIRDALATDLHAIHTGKATAQQYKALAQKINDQLAFIVTKCKLEPQTDAMLHQVLADIIDGTETMSGKNTKEASKGAEKIAAALDNYGAYFVHPDWHGVKAAH